MVFKQLFLLRNESARCGLVLYCSNSSYQGSLCRNSRISLSRASMRLIILQQCFFCCIHLQHHLRQHPVGFHPHPNHFFLEIAVQNRDSVCLRRIFWKSVKRPDAITMRLILILEECAARRSSCGDWVFGPLFVVSSHLNGRAMPGQHQTAVGMESAVWIPLVLVPRTSSTRRAPR